MTTRGRFPPDQLNAALAREVERVRDAYFEGGRAAAEAELAGRSWRRRRPAPGELLVRPTRH